MTITTNHIAETRHDAVVTNDTDPDPEVPERSRGPRRFPASYKARILTEYETLSKAEKGALLRSEGLYSSLITEWRRQRDHGAEEALGRNPGRQADAHDHCGRFFRCITRNIVTRASGFIRPQTSTTGAPNSCTHSAPRSSQPPRPPISNASSASCPCRRHYRSPRGSTSRKERSRRTSDSDQNLSLKG